MGSLEAFQEMCQTFQRNFHSKWLKWTCKFQVFEKCVDIHISQSQVLAVFMPTHAVKWPFYASFFKNWQFLATLNDDGGGVCPQEPHFLRIFLLKLNLALAFWQNYGLFKPYPGQGVAWTHGTFQKFVKVFQMVDRLKKRPFFKKYWSF